MTVPTTIPAIAPPESPESSSAAALLDAAVGVEVEVDDEDGKSGGMEVSVGKVTPGHRSVALDPMQQESVAFGELDAQ